MLGRIGKQFSNLDRKLSTTDYPAKTMGITQIPSKAATFGMGFLFLVRYEL